MRTELAPGDLLNDVHDDIGGTRIHGVVSARAATPGEPSLVFVHGLGGSTRYMEPTMRQLAPRHHVAALDFPGFGRSASPSRDLGIADHVQVLAAWLDARGIGPAVMVGNSFGCQLIVECIVRQPARVLGAVLNAPTMDPAHRSVLRMIAQFVADIPREPVSLSVIVGRDYLRAGPARLLRTLRFALDDRVEDKLPRVRVPVSVVAGARDPVITLPWAGRVAELVGRDAAGAAGGELHVIPAAAHALPYDDPDAFAALIEALLARARSTTSAAPRG